MCLEFIQEKLSDGRIYFFLGRPAEPCCIIEADGQRTLFGRAPRGFGNR
jgi:hypothetical protein